LENWERFPRIGEFKIYSENRISATVKGLQTEDRKKFTNEGMPNLISKLFEISNDYWDNVIMNVTSGYKATIPYLTIFGQIFRCPIYYIFENTDSLIKIPYVPIDINEKVFDQNRDFLFELEVSGVKEIPSNVVLKDELMSLVERYEDIISFNPIGLVLWEKYKQSIHIFMVSKWVKQELEESPNDKKNVVK